MIRAIIVDDEQHCVDRLTDLLAKDFDDTVHVMAICNTVDDAVKTIQKLQPDLVFLDIQIHEQSGFDLLKLIDKRDFEVIFTTAFDNFAVQAFRFSAIDYLLKPIDATDLQEAIGKLKQMRLSSDTSAKINLLLDNLKETNVTSKRIRVPVMNGFVMIQVSDIIRCESEINYTTFFLKDKQKLLVSKTLKEFEELLSAYHFFRVHNSHLVNLAYVKSYNKGKGGSIVLMDGTGIEISTRRKEEFLLKMAAL